jgi:hypothetical protein
MVDLLSVASGAGRYVNWGVVHISVTNLVIIALMLLVFVLALILPFPGHRRSQGRDSQ